MQPWLSGRSLWSLLGLWIKSKAWKKVLSITCLVFNQVENVALWGAFWTHVTWELCNFSLFSSECFTKVLHPLVFFWNDVMVFHSLFFYVTSVLCWSIFQLFSLAPRAPYRCCPSDKIWNTCLSSLLVLTRLVSHVFMVLLTVWWDSSLEHLTLAVTETGLLVLNTVNVAVITFEDPQLSPCLF